MGKMTGNEFLVKALQEEGVEKIFGYPGACVIDIFDEIYKQDQVELILPRHEQGVDPCGRWICKSYRKKFGVCLATSGPGATKPCYRNRNGKIMTCAIGVFLQDRVATKSDR